MFLRENVASVKCRRDEICGAQRRKKECELELRRCSAILSVFRLWLHLPPFWMERRKEKKEREITKVYGFERKKKSGSVRFLTKEKSKNVRFLVEKNSKNVWVLLTK